MLSVEASSGLLLLSSKEHREDEGKNECYDEGAASHQQRTQDKDAPFVDARIDDEIDNSGDDRAN